LPGLQRPYAGIVRGWPDVGGRLPKHVVKKGKTSVLDGDEAKMWEQSLDLQRDALKKAGCVEVPLDQVERIVL
jgi:hypothetical protein